MAFIRIGSNAVFNYRGKIFENCALDAARYDVKFCDQNFDFSSSQVPVVGVFSSLPDSSFDADDALLGKSFEQAIIIGYDLYRIRVVSQVQEQDAAMVADALYPAGKQDFLTGFAEIEVLALTSAVNILLHMFVSFEQKYPYLPA